MWGILVLYVLGVSLWAAICTSAVINQIGHGQRLKINMYWDDQRLKELGRLSISSLLPLIAAAVMTPLGARYFILTEVKFAITLMIIAYSLLIFSIIFLFLFAIYPLHQELKKEKKKQLNHIQDQLCHIEGELLSGENTQTKDLLRAQNLRSLHDKVYSTSEWPLNTTSFRLFLLYNLIPFLSIVANVRILLV